MVVIDFRNIQCLKEGKIKIKEKAVNVKYSYNGFGKSSLAKAIYYGIEEKDLLETLSPFSGGTPSINNLEIFNTCKIFNEDFVKDTLFQDNNLIDGSYNVFIGNKDLREKESNIDGLLDKLNNASSNALLNKFVIDSNDALRILALNTNGDDFDKRKTGYRGLAKTPNISSAALLTSIKDFERIINSNSPAEWLEWHKKGHNYVIGEKCPYCNSALTSKQNIYENDIDTLLDGMDFKNNKNARDVVSHKVMPYISASDKVTVSELLKDATLEKNKKDILVNNLKQISIESLKIKQLQSIRYLKSKFDNKQASVDFLSNNKLDETFFEKIGDDFKNAASLVNNNIDQVIKSIEKIISETKKYKETLEEAVNQSNIEINSFLKTAGIPYEFHIDLVGSEDATTKLTPSGKADYDIDDVRNHLSYGERNALSVALFGALAKSLNTGLIILDDPISSFDENKKFAIMNYLFNAKNGVLKDKTVILFTHDFEPVIEAIKNIVDFGKKERFITVLLKNNGVVSEVKIGEAGLISAYKKEKELVGDKSLDEYIRLIHLRKLHELEKGSCDNAYNIMSSAEHLRPKPSDKKGLEYSEEVVVDGENTIREEIEGFSYDSFIANHSLQKLIALYRSENNSCNKLILLRAIDEAMNYEIEDSDPILYNFMSINFHIESLYLYQFKNENFVPQYIIDLCDNIVDTIESGVTASDNSK